MTESIPSADIVLLHRRADKDAADKAVADLLAMKAAVSH